jgi:hypothetical protein
MDNHIIPKVAYLPFEYALSVDDFLKFWEYFFQETEGNPTQKDYDKWCLSNAKEYFYHMRGNIEDSIRLIEDN